MTREQIHERLDELESKESLTRDERDEMGRLHYILSELELASCN